MQKIIWLLSRLRAMSLSEIFYRLYQKTQAFNDKLKNKYKKIDRISCGGGKKLFSSFNNGISYDLNKIPIFSYTIDIYKNINWFLDISSNKKFLNLYSKSIDTRNNQYGDVKYVWEVNRLQFLIPIAAKFNSTKENYYLDLFAKHITNWSKHNPYLMGVNWYSNIEVNIRLIVWMCCWDILDANKLKKENAEFNSFVENIWLPLIYLHCVYSYKNPSLFSSANNHRIAELAGLYIASSYWQFKESEKWKKYSKKRLEQEIVKQHYENGTNKEEASEYIQFITDFFLLSYLIGVKTDNPFSEQYKEYLRNIFEFIYDSTDVKTNHLKYGDEDEGYVVKFDYEEGFNNFQSLLLSGYLLFNEEKYLERVNSVDNKNKFLFGEKATIVKTSSKKEVDKNIKVKEYNGHLFIRSYNANREILFHLNAAPLGYLSLAAHGHADALSFTLNYDGSPIFVDPGTYLYYSHPEYRKYFKGTIAHNTVRINKQDQAKYLGSMLWGKHYKTKSVVKNNSEKVNLWAAHDGYDSLKVNHEREIEFDSLTSEIIIIDNIVNSSEKEIEIEIPFHLHPNIGIIKIDKNQFELQSNNNSCIQLTIDEKLSPVIMKGNREPIIGWYSESFGKIEPTNTMYSKINIAGTTKFYTKIIFGEY